MQELKGDIWGFHSNGYWIVIPINGTIKKNGEAVMGRGLALQAKEKFPGLPEKLGFQMRMIGQLCVFDTNPHLILFPVKYNWWDKASIFLITKSTLSLVEHIANYEIYKTPIYLPRVGCGNGKLDWEEVKPILEKYLDDRFVVVNNV